MGSNAKKPRHIYSNPLDPIVCPVFAFALYLTTLNVQAMPNGKLFPGSGQSTRFSKFINDALSDHEEEVKALGYQLSDLGTHSIWKGAATYCAG